MGSQSNVQMGPMRRREEKGENEKEQVEESEHKGKENVFLEKLFKNQACAGKGSRTHKRERKAKT